MAHMINASHSYSASLSFAEMRFGRVTILKRVGIFADVGV